MAKPADSMAKCHGAIPRRAASDCVSALRASAQRALKVVENPHNASNPSSEQRRSIPGFSK
eukprot:4677073-Lingulodinium_polyedra.AAC.1